MNYHFECHAAQREKTAKASAQNVWLQTELKSFQHSKQLLDSEIECKFIISIAKSSAL